MWTSSSVYVKPCPHWRL